MNAARGASLALERKVPIAAPAKICPIGVAIIDETQKLSSAITLYQEYARS
jgi:hypothetical protein